MCFPIISIKENEFQKDVYHQHVNIWGVSLTETPLDWALLPSPPTESPWTETHPSEQNDTQV